MKEKIQELLDTQKLLKGECLELLQEPNQLNDISMSKEDKRVLEDTILKTKEEYNMRLFFISDLENLLS